MTRPIKIELARRAAQQKAPAAPVLAEALSFGKCKGVVFASNEYTMNASYEPFATVFTAVQRDVLDVRLRTEEFPRMPHTKLESGRLAAGTRLRIMAMKCII